MKNQIKILATLREVAAGGKVVFLFSLLFFCLFSTSCLSATKGISLNLKKGKKATEKVELYKGGSYALIIGESQYYKGWPKLEAVSGELDKVEGVLKRKGFRITRKDDLGGRELESTFRDFIDQYGYHEENRLIFYYSGHGHTRKNNEKGYLVPVDAPNPENDERLFLRKALPMSQVLSWARRIEAKHVMFLFDSCFSGTIFKTKDLPKTPPAISYASINSVRQFITAGSAGETVPAQSVFTPAFVDALAYGWGDLNKDGYISGTELGLYLQGKVPRFSNQFPQYGKINDYSLSRGDFIFLAGGNPDDVASDAPPSYQGKPTTGKLKVTSRPSGALVKLDGKPAGNTPVQLGNMPPGSLRVAVSRSGYLDQVKRATIKVGRRTVVSFDLQEEEKNGWLTVSATPSGAKIRILNIGPAYSPGMELEEGRYHIEVSSSGYTTEKRWVEIAAGDEITVDFSLERKRAVHVTKKVHSSSSSKSFTESITDMEFVRIEKGCFQMGSPGSEKDRDSDEGPVHRVCVDSFYMGKYEVTVAQWRQFIRETSYRTDAEKDTKKEGCYVWINNKWGWQDGYSWDRVGFSQRSNQPVACVSHNDVEKFIEWLQRKSGKQYRLPTEAEWEYAARGGTSTSRYWGGTEDSTACSYANAADKAYGSKNRFPCDDGYEYSSPVGNYRPNAFGLYDMLGNVWEWTGDWYGKDYYGRSGRNNPTGPSS
ncbi:MAG: SUMF1/EgtB/PvdO family nonheme iron enzyme, partial [Desulfobacterales bacterium]|nr:SUMF1/EgtB/PvdO family nonheme iron enzyme [Desulfobacterales bacterium]